MTRTLNWLTSIVLLVSVLGCGHERPPIITAAFNGDIDSLRRQIKLGVDVNVTEKEGRSFRPEIIGGWTPLIMASTRGHADCVKELLSAEGIEVDKKHSIVGKTALMFALESGHNDVAVLLLEAGADIEAQDNGGRTAAVFAASSSDPDTMKIVSEYGAQRRTDGQ